VSVLLDAVREARELREAAAREWGRAIVRASDGGHSLREIAGAAGLKSWSTVAHILRRERGDTKP